jgi:phosphonoacetaldehyde hydrolase
MDFIFRRIYRGPIKAVILDWAGTAVDYGSFAPTAVFLRLFEMQGVKITAEDARSGMGLMKKDHVRTILARPAVAAAWKTAHGSPATEDDVERLFDDFAPMQRDILMGYAEPIPGLQDTMRYLHARGIKVGSTTGYLRSMMDVLAPKAKELGYAPDCIVCSDEVPAGRPAPWMCYQNAMQLGVYPMQAMIKVGDTIVDIEEGLNAGMWTVGLSITGSLFGQTEEEVKAMHAEQVICQRAQVATRLYEAGAHEVIDGIWDLQDAVEAIECKLEHGEHL